MVNPYICYAFSFLLALITYALHWSTLYPRLSSGLLFFLGVTILLHVLAGFLLMRKRKIVFPKITLQDPRSAIYITLFIYALWTADFVYEGGIPLLKILFKIPYNYRLFGIPSLHVFIVTFSSFYTVYLFHVYLSTRQKTILCLYAINMAAAILIYSRAMFIFNLTASFILILLIKKIVTVRLLIVLPLMILLSYFFGVLGTLRVSRELNVPYDNSLFTELGRPTESFSQSIIPNEFLWTYIYVSSPLANLQHNINSYPVKPASLSRTGEMINNEVLMDFISKRVNAFFHKEREQENTIPGPFNVSTVYSRSYSYLGWTGIVLMAVIVILIPWAYLKILPMESQFFAAAFAILCTMFLFLAYDNTIRFTGLCFQLVYPVLFNFIVKRINLAKKIIS